MIRKNNPRAMPRSDALVVQGRMIGTNHSEMERTESSGSGVGSVDVKEIPAVHSRVEESHELRNPQGNVSTGLMEPGRVGAATEADCVSESCSPEDAGPPVQAATAGSVGLQLSQLAQSLGVLQRQAAASQVQATAADQQAEMLREAQNSLQAGIRTHSVAALETARQLEELSQKLAGTPQSPEMGDWLRQLQDSLAKLAALGTDEP